MKVKNKSPWMKAKNSVDEHTETSRIHFDIEENAIKSVGNTVTFSKPVTITDNSEMWSGAKYDIPSLDISQYSGKLTADHIDKIQNVIGSVIGVKKVANRRVTIDGIKFAADENPLADYAKRMMMAGHLTDFSIETLGPWPEDDGVFKNAKLVGLSLVVTGNNKQAHINEIAEQTMKDAKAHGLDTAVFAQALKLPIDNENTISDNNIMKFKTVKNSRGFAITLKFKNSAGEDVEVKVEPGKTVDVPETPENKDVEVQVTDATEPKPAEEAPKTETPAHSPSHTNGEEANRQAESITKAVEAATKPLMAKIEAIEKNTFDNSASEPRFTKANSSGIITELSGMDYRERHGVQINLAWDMLKAGNTEAGKKLNDINKFHMEELKKAGKVLNSTSIADFGNFVISPELLKDIEGFRSDFGALLAKVNFRDTLSLQMAWLVRNGDINMQEVDIDDSLSVNGNLKPISEYSANIKTSNLHELAAVTPVCNSATRFLAADLLGDIAQGYRTDFDRKKAQLFIARLQQAVNQTGLVQHYSTTTNLTALQSFFGVGAAMQEDVMGGTFILSHASYFELLSRQMAFAANDGGLKIFTSGANGDLMLGAPYIIVPNELLPKLGSSQTKTFTIEGAPVVITDAVFYVDISTFSGRTSGGLNYDLSTEAAYEESGVVKSAFQRNELVLRGSFFRGGAVRDVNKVVGLEAVNLS